MRMSHSIWVSLAETLAASRVAALLPLTRPAALGFSGRDAFGKNDASRCSSYTQLLTYPIRENWYNQIFSLVFLFSRDDFPRRPILLGPFIYTIIVFMSVYIFFDVADAALPSFNMQSIVILFLFTLILFLLLSSRSLKSTNYYYATPNTFMPFAYVIFILEALYVFFDLVRDSFPAMLISNLQTEILVIIFLILVVLVMIAPTLFSWGMVFPLFLTEKIISLLNWLTGGRAVGAIGLTIAFMGVLGEVYQVITLISGGYLSSIGS